ncbi:MAG: bestrophin family protein [Myxococcaceae bacterium]
MHIGHNYSVREVLHWTRRDLRTLLIISAIPTTAYVLLGWKWLAIPWLPVALVGTAVAFVVGFKNNASYDRLWEARRIWGAIVNASRTFGVMARDYVSDKHTVAPCTPEELEAVRRTLFSRHYAWLTALRHQLREPRPWEGIYKVHNAEYKNRWFRVDEHDNPVGPALAPYLSAEEHARVMSASNKAAQIIALQSAHLAVLLRKGWIEDFRHMELGRLLAEFLAQQGAAERIKNFPYPRQLATLNLWFIKMFALLIPLGMLQEFEKLGGQMVWLTIPFAALSGWIFTTMEKIGESSESPFEGSANDVPITTMSRAIEIDMRQMLGETHVPAPIAAVHNILT